MAPRLKVKSQSHGMPEMMPRGALASHSHAHHEEKQHHSRSHAHHEEHHKKREEHHHNNKHHSKAHAEKPEKPVPELMAERAAEMTALPQSMVMAVYERLRPGRAQDKAALLAVAADLRREHGAERLAAFVEEAAEVYARRGLFKTRF